MQSSTIPTSVVVSTVASQQEGSWFKSRLEPFCVEFACSPRVWVGSLRVFWPKNMYVRLIDHSKLTRGVSVSVDGCLSRVAL